MLEFLIKRHLNRTNEDWIIDFHDVSIYIVLARSLVLPLLLLKARSKSSGNKSDTLEFCPASSSSLFGSPTCSPL